MILTVETAGTLTMVQDLGRAGVKHLGVPPSGALDPAALALANRLVGNRDTAAGLEILLGGLRLRPSNAVRIAVTGGQVGVRVGGRAMSWGVAESVPAGEIVEITAAPTDLRSWLAVSGGIDVPTVLGSRSTDTLSGLGPPPLANGTELPLGRSQGEAVPGASAVPVSRPPVLSLPVTLGPRDDWFAQPALDLLAGQDYVVTPDSNRTALRLEGASPLERCRSEELASEGLVLGAVQVPASGQPLVFLADHPVTGGYPVIGVVSPSALAACAQARPGDAARFRLLPRSGR